MTPSPGVDATRECDPSAGISLVGGGNFNVALRNKQGRGVNSPESAEEPIRSVVSGMGLGGIGGMKSGHKGRGGSWREVVSGVTWGWGMGLTSDSPAIDKWRYIRTELLSGLMVCFAQIPESVAFAFMANVAPPVGLHSAWTVGLLSTALGGRPGMINGATGSLSAVVATFVSHRCAEGTKGKHCVTEYVGMEDLYISLIIAAALMFIFAFLRLSCLIRLVPTPVMFGFVNGLAVIIGTAQLHFFQEAVEDDDGYVWVAGYKAAAMIFLTLLAMVLMEFFPRIPKIGHVVPSSLVAVAACSAIELGVYRIAIPGFNGTPTIGDVAPFSRETALPPFIFTNSALDFSKNLSSWSSVLMQGITLFAVATIESCMTVEVISDLQRNEGNGDQQVFGMACGNSLAAILGGMGGNSMIGLSVMNYRNGSTGKESGVVTALGIFAMMLGGYPLLNFIPVAALAGVMFIVVIHTMKWSTLLIVLASALPEQWRKKHPALARKIKRSDALVIIIVTVVTVVTRNLAIAIIIGVCLSSLIFAWDTSKRLAVDAVLIDGVKYYEVSGALFFASKSSFLKIFQYDTDPDQVVLLLKASGPIADYSALEAINTVKMEYRLRGKQLRVKGLTPECVELMAKAHHLLKSVDFRFVEVDIPLVHPFAAYQTYEPGVVTLNYKARREKKAGGDGNITQHDHIGIPLASAQSIEEGIAGGTGGDTAAYQQTFLQRAAAALSSASPAVTAPTESIRSSFQPQGEAGEFDRPVGGGRKSPAGGPLTSPTILPTGTSQGVVGVSAEMVLKLAELRREMKRSDPAARRAHDVAGSTLQVVQAADTAKSLSGSPAVACDTKRREEDTMNPENRLTGENRSGKSSSESITPREQRAWITAPDAKETADTSRSTSSPNLRLRQRCSPEMSARTPSRGEVSSSENSQDQPSLPSAYTGDTPSRPHM